MNNLKVISSSSIKTIIASHRLYNTLKVSISNIINEEILKKANIESMTIQINYDNIKECYNSYALITPKVCESKYYISNDELKYYTDMANKFAFKN